jgi:hypothetical protein
MKLEGYTDEMIAYEQGRNIVVRHNGLRIAVLVPHAGLIEASRSSRAGIPT